MDAMKAVPAEGFVFPPFHVEALRYGWHIVCNVHGFNCLTFPEKPGAVVTSKDHAEEICNEWNEKYSA